MTYPIAVIFDMDGVIIDSNPHHKIALREFCEKYGYQLTDEQLINKIYGRTNNEWIANLFERSLTYKELNEFGEEKESLFREIYKNHIQPLPGLRDFLEALGRHDIPCAIGTSAPRSNVDFVLKETRLEKYFEIILDQADVTHGKPNPEIYTKVVGRLGIATNQCVVFEDSLSGVAAAQAAGTKVVGVATTHSREELLHTDFVIKDFVDLDPIVLFREIFKT